MRRREFLAASSGSVLLSLAGGAGAAPAAPVAEQAQELEAWFRAVEDAGGGGGGRMIPARWLRRGDVSLRRGVVMTMQGLEGGDEVPAGIERVSVDVLFPRAGSGPVPFHAFAADLGGGGGDAGRSARFALPVDDAGAVALCVDLIGGGSAKRRVVRLGCGDEPWRAKLRVGDYRVPLTGMWRGPALCFSVGRAGV